MPISKLGKRRQVVIPKNICEQLSLQEGDFVEVDLRDNAVLIKPKKLIDADDVLSPEEEAIVRRGEGQLQQGKGVPWPEVKKHLKR